MYESYVVMSALSPKDLMLELISITAGYSNEDNPAALNAALCTEAYKRLVSTNGEYTGAPLQLSECVSCRQ